MAKEALTHSDRYVRKTNRIILIVGIITLCLFVFGLLLLGAEEPEEEQKYEVESTIDAETDLGMAAETSTEAEIEFGDTKEEEKPITLMPNPVNMGQVVVGHEATNVLTVGTNGKSAIRIISVELEDAPFEGFSFKTDCNGKELRGKITCNVLMNWLPTIAANVQNNFKIIWHETRLSERDAKHDEVTVFGNAVTKEECNYCDSGSAVANNAGNMLSDSGNVRYAVGPDGKIIGVISDDGIVHDDNGNEIGHVTADGLIVDRDGNVIGVASTGRLVMDENGNVVGYVDANGVAYDADGNAIGNVLADGTVVDANGHVIGKALNYGYVYDDNGNIIGRVLEDGTVVDLDGNVIGRVNENGEVADFNGNIIGRVAKSGEVMFDENGNPIGIVMPNGAVVNENGDVVGRVDKNGNTIAAKKIGRRGPNMQLAVDKDGNVIGYIDENGVVRDFSGNIAGNIDKNGNVVDENGNIIGKASDQWSDLAVDANGKVIGYVDKDGLVHQNNEIIGYVNDKGEIMGNPIEEQIIGKVSDVQRQLAFDASGNAIGYVDEDGNVRDFKGNIIGKVNKDGNVVVQKTGTGNIIGKKGDAVTLAYDANGNVIGYIDENGNVIDANGNIVGHVDENGNVVDENGNILGRRGDSVYWALDDDGNMIGYIDEKGVVRDFNSNIVGISDENGNIKALGTEIIGRLINKNLLPITPEGKVLGTINNRGEVVYQQQVLGKMQPSGLVTDISGSRILAVGINPGIVVNWGCDYSARLDKDGVVRRDGVDISARVYADGTVWSNDEKYIGSVITTGRVYDNECQYIGEVSADGYVRDQNGREVGCINPDGSVLDLEKPNIKGHLVEPKVVYSGDWQEIGLLDENGSLRAQNGEVVGCMNDNGEVLDRHLAYIGTISDAEYAFGFDGKYLGKIDTQGRLRNSGYSGARVILNKYIIDEAQAIIGYVAPKVNILYDSQGKKLGHLFPDGYVYDATGTAVGKINGGENGFYKDVAAKFLYPGFVVDKDGQLLGKIGYDLNVVDFKGSVVGKINIKGQMINAGGQQIGGIVKQGGVRAHNGIYLGYVLKNGNVVELEDVESGDSKYRRGEITGRILPDGYVVKEREIIGEVLPQDLMVDIFGNYIGYSNDHGVVVGKDGTYIAALLPGGSTTSNLNVLPQGFVINYAGQIIGLVLPTGQFTDRQGIVNGRVLADGKVISSEGKFLGEVVSGDIVIGNNDKVKGSVGFDGQIYYAGAVIGRSVTDFLAVDLQNNILGHIYNIGQTVLSNEGEFIGRMGANGRVLRDNNQEIGFIKSNGSFVDMDKNVSGYSLPEVARNRRN